MGGDRIMPTHTSPANASAARAHWRAARPSSLARRSSAFSGTAQHQISPSVATSTALIVCNRFYKHDGQVEATLSNTSSLTSISVDRTFTRSRGTQFGVVERRTSNA